jgi:hypothetical protein
MGWALYGFSFVKPWVRCAMVAAAVALVVVFVALVQGCGGTTASDDQADRNAGLCQPVTGGLPVEPTLATCSDAWQACAAGDNTLAHSENCAVKHWTCTTPAGVVERCNTE